MTWTWTGRRLWVVSALAAAVLVGTAVRVLTPPPYGDPPREDLLRAGAIRLVAPGDRIDRNTAFQWSSPVRADHFRVVVLDVSGGIVYVTTARTEQLQPGAELWTQLRPSQLYTWSVEAFDEKGQPIARSADRSFTYAPTR